MVGRLRMTPRLSLPVHAAALAFFAALAGAFLWPLPAHLATHYAVRVPGPAGFSADLPFTSWVLASDVHRLVHDPLRVFETNNLHPFRHTLAFGENMLGIAVLVLPVQLLGGNPTLTHNVALLLAIVLAGWATFLLVHELCGSVAAAVIAGALMIYSPLVWGEIILLPLLAGYWTPVALLLLVRLLRAPRWRTAVLLAAAVALQAWTSLQNALFLALALPVTAATLVLVSARGRRALGHIAAAGVLAGALCVPLLLPYRAVRSELEAEGRYGAATFSLVLDRVTPPFRRPLAYLVERARSGEHIQAVGTLVPWILVAAGVLAGVGRGARRSDPALVAALAAGALANLLFALGPADDPWLPSLYRALVTVVPGLAWVRVPMRAAGYTYLVLCVLAGWAAASLLGRIGRPWVRVAVATVALALIVIEAGWRPIPLIPATEPAPALASALAGLAPGCGVGEIPADINTSGAALARSTAHWRGLINGFSGFYPVAPQVTYAFLNAFPAPDALAFVAAAGGCAVIVRPPLTERVLAASRAAGLAAEPAGADMVVRVPPAAPLAEGAPLSRARWRVAPEAGPDGAAVLDGDLETTWRGSVRGNEAAERLTVDLGDTVTVAAVALDLGHRFPLYLRSYRVEGSPDGATWTTLAEKPLAVPPFASYREDHRRVRQRIDFPASAVRWLRVGPYRRPPARTLDPDGGWTTWAVAELQAFAPPGR
jgi:hypothetical protein